MSKFRFFCCHHHYFIIKCIDNFIKNIGLSLKIFATKSNKKMQTAWAMLTKSISFYKKISSKAAIMSHCYNLIILCTSNKVTDALFIKGWEPVNSRKSKAHIPIYTHPLHVRVVRYTTRTYLTTNIHNQHLLCSKIWPAEESPRQHIERWRGYRGPQSLQAVSLWTQALYAQ